MAVSPGLSLTESEDRSADAPGLTDTRPAQPESKFTLPLPCSIQAIAEASALLRSVRQSTAFWKLPHRRTRRRVLPALPAALALPRDAGVTCHGSS